MITTWHILAGEYPPQRGGVSDYTEQLARGLSDASDAVNVWCPGVERSVSDRNEKGGVTVHRMVDAFAPHRLPALGRALKRFSAPRTLLVQYAPNAFGLRGLNVFFCLWLAWRGVIGGDDVRVMFHEPFYYFARNQKLRLNLLALVQRVMAILLLAAGRVAYVSTPAWGKLLRRFSILRRVTFQWLPVPATIPFSPDHEGVAAIRKTIAEDLGDGLIVGHFGTYGELLSQTLTEVLRRILKSNSSVVCLCLGQNADAFVDSFRRQHPEFSERIVARGYLEREALSSHLQVCDLFVQPYADGATARRTSLMSLLHNGLPAVSNLGQYSEPVWRNSDAVALASKCNASELAQLAFTLIDDEARRSHLSRESRRFYEQHFSLGRTINTLKHENQIVAVDENGLHAEAR